MINQSEEFVYRLCKRSFLSLWSYADPIRSDDDKELCDILVMCDPDIVIFSVKEVHYHTLLNISVAMKRWERRAVTKSVKQIYRAVKWIVGGKKILVADSREEIAFPVPAEMTIHRVAVALGSKGNVPIGSGDYGKGFVHVYDEKSVKILLEELDTITDFIHYLSQVESLLAQNRRVIIHGGGGEEDLLAYYLQNNRSFPDNFDALIMDGTLWEGFSTSAAYKQRNAANRISYIWDKIIEIFAEEVRESNLEYESTPGETELVLRAMAREHRFERRILGELFAYVHRNTPAGQKMARITSSTSGVTYVFLVCPIEMSREARRQELGLRCYIARNISGGKTVVGIATEHYDPAGFSLDACFLKFEAWTNENQERAAEIQREFGYFANMRAHQQHFDEYPT